MNDADYGDGDGDGDDDDDDDCPSPHQCPPSPLSAPHTVPHRPRIHARSSPAGPLLLPPILVRHPCWLMSFSPPISIHSCAHTIGTRPHALMPTRPLSPPIATHSLSLTPSAHARASMLAHAHGPSSNPFLHPLHPHRPRSCPPGPSHYQFQLAPTPSALPTPISIHLLAPSSCLPGPFPHLFPSRSPILVRPHPPHTFAQISRSRLTEQTRTQGSKILLGIRVPRAPLFNDVQNHLLHCTVSYNFDID